MKRAKKESGKTIDKKVKKTIKPRSGKPADTKIEDVQKLVELLQIHQIELEHQNQELRITQEELEVSRSKYVNLFDFSPIPYFTLDTDGVIREVNLSASRMFGVERGKLIGKRFTAYIPPGEADTFKSFVDAVFNSPEKHSLELKVINKDKRVFHVLLEGVELSDTLEQGRKCQVALIDLTEYKRVEDVLKAYSEELKILNATKDKFFSIIAHDLRSPFQSLLSSSEMLATQIGDLSQEDIMLVSKGLNENLINLHGLLENLLHWSLMQRNMLEFKPAALNLYDVVNKVIEISNQSAIKKNIALSNKVDTGVIVYADVDMLRSVLQNLVVNAIKFTRPEGRITVSSTDKKSYVEVSVQDTGRGIESERISKLFSFNTISTTGGTAGEKGTGLGLPLCREFVERNNGNIWVESEPGKGSKFTFTLGKPVR